MLCCCTSIANSWVEKPYFVSSRVAWATASNRESVILGGLLGEVKLLKGEVGGGLRELPNHRFHRHGGKLLRLLWERILVSTEAVLVSPGHFMGSEQAGHICGVNIKAGAVSHNTGRLAAIGVGDAKAPPLVVHKPVKGTPPLRAQVLPSVIHHLHRGRRPPRPPSCPVVSQHCPAAALPHKGGRRPVAPAPPLRRENLLSHTTRKRGVNGDGNL